MSVEAMTTARASMRWRQWLEAPKDGTELIAIIDLSAPAPDRRKLPGGGQEQYTVPRMTQPGVRVRYTDRGWEQVYKSGWVLLSFHATHWRLP